MTVADLVEQRLANQGVSRAGFKTVESVVRFLGAAQSQDYPAATWAVGQRARARTHHAIDRAFDEGRILRTHVMRPTWHFVMPADIRWMLQLTGPRVNAMSAPYYRRMELDARTFSKSRALLTRVLGGGKQLTRAALSAEFQKAGITKRGDTPLRVVFIMLQAELDGLVCSGVRIGKEFTYALLDERVPPAPPLDRDESRAELARRYFTSHGPATLHDFSWWSGQTVGDARTGLEMVKSELEEMVIEGKTYWSPRIVRSPKPPRAAYLLPPYDEALLSYRDMRGMLTPHAAQLGRDGYTMVIDGRVVGTWRRVVNKSGLTIAATPFESLSRRDVQAIEDAADAYGRFMVTPVTVEVKGRRV